ncbi:MAG TPA: hypothetical protein VFX49_00205, partial [Chloroflexota bacterium]|nr:hypothetical protein [Chloroflexota bacterium]
LAAGMACARQGSAWGSRRAAGVALVAAAGVALVFNLRVMGATPDETSLRLYSRPAYVAARDIAAYVREHTGEDDTIYAAFAQADLYHLSGRRAAARQLYWTEINRVPGALDDLLDTMADQARRPAYVIGIDRELEQPGRADRFWMLVARHYALEREIGGFPIYRVVGG